MRILVSGSHGLIGRTLIEFLKRHGHVIRRLVRGEAKSKDEIAWDPHKGISHPETLEEFNAVINLAGENVFGFWTESKQAEIYESRVVGTRVLCEALSELKYPPKVLISGSAIGYYGDSGERELTEECPVGDTFLSKVCKDWEEATKKAKESNIRVVLLRTSVVLTPKGGALAQMLPVFRLGLGGVLGSGEQYMSWITLDDLIHVILFALTHNRIRGPLNATSPHPVTNREFTEALGYVLHRPTFITVPACLMKFTLGKMAEELLLSSTRAIPKHLLEENYTFLYPKLEGALSHLLR